MQFYYIASGNSATYAPSIIEKSREDEEKSDVNYECPRCGSMALRDAQQDVVLVLERKKTNPDQLMCGAKPSLFILSERAINIFEANRITGYQVHGKVTLADKRHTPIIDYPNKYYNVLVTGICRINYGAMGIEANIPCDRCSQGDFSIENWQIPSLQPYYQDWDGSDLFHYNGFPFSRMCSSRLAKLIVKEKLSNFSFYDWDDAIIMRKKKACTLHEILHCDEKMQVGTG